jgi:hypothetical protein
MRVDFGIEMERLFFRLGEHFYKLASSIEKHSYMLWDSATVAEPIILVTLQVFHGDDYHEVCFL